MTAKLNANLLKDPSGEAATPSPSGYDGVVPIPGWTTTSGMTVDTYGESEGDLSVTEAPAAAGSNYFYGGPANSSSSATQTVHFAGLATAINAGEVSATIGGYLGGYGPQTDHVDISVSFLNAHGGVIGTAAVNGPTSFPNGSALTHEATTVVVPSGAVAATYTLTATRDEGSDNDGLADKLSFILRQIHTAAALAPLADLAPTGLHDAASREANAASARDGGLASARDGALSDGGAAGHPNTAYGIPMLPVGASTGWG